MTKGLTNIFPIIGSKSEINKKKQSSLDRKIKKNIKKELSDFKELGHTKEYLYKRSNLNPPVKNEYLNKNFWGQKLTVKQSFYFNLDKIDERIAFLTKRKRISEAIELLNNIQYAYLSHGYHISNFEDPKVKHLLDYKLGSIFYEPFRENGQLTDYFMKSVNNVISRLEIMNLNLILNLILKRKLNTRH